MPLIEEIRGPAEDPMAYADGDPDIHILNNLNNVGAIEVNPFSRRPMW